MLFAVLAATLPILLSAATGQHVHIPRGVRDGPRYDLTHSLVQNASYAVYFAASRSAQPARTCEELECPPYKVVCKESDFEIRHYRQSSWVVTKPMTELSYVLAATRGFHRLFEYVQGANKNGTKIGMTAPVLTEVTVGEGPFDSQSFTVGFYLPYKYSEHPPLPLENQDLKVRRYHSRCVAVRRFNGFAVDHNVPDQALRLQLSLEGTPWENATTSCAHRSKKVVCMAYSVAVYNAPFTIKNRVNEIWAEIPHEDVEHSGCRYMGAPCTLANTF
eukprot:SM000028S10157  [mRNA]  locus=s28:727637:729146:+ [translate_table: standard]